MHRDGLIGLKFPVKLCEDKQIKLLGNYRFIFAQLIMCKGVETHHSGRLGAPP